MLNLMWLMAMQFRSQIKDEEEKKEEVVEEEKKAEEITTSKVSVMLLFIQDLFCATYHHVNISHVKSYL